MSVITPEIFPEPPSLVGPTPFPEPPSLESPTTDPESQGAESPTTDPESQGAESPTSEALFPHYEVAIVGAGFSGLGMAVRLRQQGLTDFVVLERGDDVGGTWRVNTYPGCQCDVPSHLYSFSFAPNPNWSETYSSQAEILAYLRRVAREQGIAPHLRLRCEVTSMAWDPAIRGWSLQTSRGPLTAGIVVAAPGPLSEPSIPAVPGLERFQGTIFHSAQWDHDHDLDGERVAVVGTGASAIQFVPRIQARVGRLHLFQRTPPWVLPHPNRPTSELERHAYRRLVVLQRLNRALVYWGRELLVLGFAKDRRLMRLPTRLARAHIARQVRDPELRSKLTPHYTFGCKRVLPSNDWYPALDQPNVELIPSALAEVREHSVVGADGTEREIDTIIFGTGFHVSDFPAARMINGRDGRNLHDIWRGSPQAYRGTTVAGFPNLFLLVGPNTGLGHTSIVYMAESQIAYVLDCLRTMRRDRVAAVEVRSEAQERFNDQVQQLMPPTVWNSGGCASWYLDANGRNTTLWPDFTFRFRQQTRRFDPEHYRLEPAGQPADRGRALAQARA